MIIRKSQQEIEGMARAGDIVADTLAMIGEELGPGVSMLELDRLAEEYIRERGEFRPRRVTAGTRRRSVSLRTR